MDRVLHNRPGVRPDTVRRVREAIERNSFQPHVAAAELARAAADRVIGGAAEAAAPDAAVLEDLERIGYADGDL